MAIHNALMESRLSMAILYRGIMGGGFVNFSNMLFGYLLPAALSGAYTRIRQAHKIVGVQNVQGTLTSIVPFPVGACILAILITQPEWLVRSEWLIGGTVALVSLFVLFKMIKFSIMQRVAERLRHEREQQQEVVPARTWGDYPVSEAVRAAVETARLNKREFLLARIDVAGRAHCEYGALPFLPSVSSEQFRPRDHFHIDIVLHDDSVFVKKDFRDDRTACVTEWLNLEMMYGKANVPAVRIVDLKASVLYMDVVCGKTLLELLREKSAVPSGADVENDFILPPKGTGRRKVNERCSQLLSSSFSELFFKELDDVVDAVHRCRITDLDLRYDNVLVDDAGKPWLVDFHTAKAIPRSLEWLLRVQCDADYRTYNRLFGRNKLTESAARKLLSNIKAHAAKCSVDMHFGHTPGTLRWHDPDTDRWERIMKRHFPDLRNKRVFVLNAGNGFFPMLMLRAGAREVVGSEKNKLSFDVALALHRIFEWYDMRSYRFTLHSGDVRRMELHGEEVFDVVVASVSLDHFYPKEFNHVAKFLSEKTPLMIVAVDNGVPKSGTGLRKLTEIERMTSLMSDNGSRHVSVEEVSEEIFFVVSEPKKSCFESEEDHMLQWRHCNNVDERVSYVVQSSS